CRRQRLDLAAEDLDVGLLGAHDVRLDLFPVVRGTRDATRDLEEITAHAAVPPTVISRMRTVGWPDDTGTLWPCLPHMPVQVSKSLPTASTMRMTSGPLPMSCAARIGRVISPFSMRYASVTPNTKSPLAGSTWPPPSC